MNEEDERGGRKKVRRRALLGHEAHVHDPIDGYLIDPNLDPTRIINR